MKIIDRIEFSITDFGLLETFRDDHWHEGDIALAGGGPSKEQKAAAAAQTNLTNTLGDVANREEAFKEAQQNKVNPFYESRMRFGDPNTPLYSDFASGINARAYAPARANIMRRFSNSALPSGSKEAMLNDFEDARARGFDNSLTGVVQANEQAKQAGASGLMGQAQIADPLGYYSGALQGNQSIMAANLRRPGFAGTAGALIGGGLQAFA